MSKVLIIYLPIFLNTLNYSSGVTLLNSTFVKKEEGAGKGKTGGGSGESLDLSRIQIGVNCINYFCSGYELKLL